MKNGVMIQYFEWNLPNDGSLWRQLARDAEHLHDIGITSVWIPPVYKADEQQDEGYAVYDLYDLGEFDQKGTRRTKYGTLEELQEAIEALHRNDISVYMDTVMNHRMGGDRLEEFEAREVDSNDRTKISPETVKIKAWTGFEFEGRANRYSDFKWHYYHFTGTDQTEENHDRKIYLIEGEGKHWSEGVDSEMGNYDYLLSNDVDFDHPEVVEEMKRWGVWVSRKLGIDGMRLDAIKHIERLFIADFAATLHREIGDKFYIVGEYWSDTPEALDEYLEAVGHSLDLFDAPLHYNLFRASNQGRDFDMQTLLDGSLVRLHPTLAVTFVENHDSQRGSSLESEVKAWFKPQAYALILLMKEGYPCIFYGDYYGVGGKPSPHRHILDLLLDLRRNRAFGDQIEYFDHPSTVGFTRTGDAAHPNSGVAVLLSAGDSGSKRMSVGKAHAGEIWHEATGAVKGQVEIDTEGEAEFAVEGGKAAVWVKA